MVFSQNIHTQHFFYSLQIIDNPMELDQKQQFIENFFDYNDPIPGETQFNEGQLKSNDMKIALEIATRSNLRMQSDPKTNEVWFSCKNFGKSCFQMLALKNENNSYVVQDYQQNGHERKCELHNQSFEYLKIYNLMKLKKDLIEEIMISKRLMSASPSYILETISVGSEYFFQKHINYNVEMRRKLRKRFDNIINIDIKKITKGGREQCRSMVQQEMQNQPFNQNRGRQIAVKQQPQKMQAPEEETSVFRQRDENFKRPNIFKKKNKKQKQNAKNFKNGKPFKEKQNSVIKNKISKPNSSQALFSSYQKIDQQIFVNPNSDNELKEIKQLNEEFPAIQYFLSWSSDNSYQPIYPQETINDKVRENGVSALKHCFAKKPQYPESLSYLPEQLPQVSDFNDYEQMI